MKLFSAEQIRQIDAATIKNEPISAIDLVERAGTACCEWITQHYSVQYSFHVFCGMGNNGADGLAVARILLEKGYSVAVHPVAHRSNGNPSFDRNIERLIEAGADIDYIADRKDLPIVDDHVIAIDAILGTGLSKSVRGLLKDVVTGLNEAYNHVISIDVPTGLPSDVDVELGPTCVKANHTLTFQFPKLSFMVGVTGKYTGDIHVVDIGLDDEAILDTQTPYFITTEYEVESIRGNRSMFSHKGDYGHALLVAGQRGMMGAAVLTSKGCMRSGVGLVTSHIPSCGEQIIQISAPEVMVSIDSSSDFITDTPEFSGYAAIGMGPGMGRHESTFEAIEPLLKSDILKVIDADAIHLITDYGAWNELNGTVIVTPHLGEFRKMMNDPELSAEKAIAKARSWASEHEQYLLLKGAYSALCTPQGDVFFNGSGHPAMATAGSGDVLTGVLTGMLAQGLEPLKAMRLGVWNHGLAGELAANLREDHAVIASDIIEEL